MKLKRLTNYLLIIAVSIFIFGVGFKFGEYENKRKDTLLKFNSNLIYEVWKDLQAKFIDKKKLDSEKMFYGAIKGMVASLEDPYTFFLTPDENKQSKDDLQGKFEGIGAQLGLKDGRIIIIAPLKNSPAEKAGVLAGDFINKVDGASTRSWILPQAVSKIRGTKGTPVVLTLERQGKELDKKIVRDQIIVSSVELSYEGAVAVLKLNQFGENTNDEWDKAVSEISQKWQEKKIKGMVLDVRDNPGGYLESSVYLASEFLPIEKLIVKQESTTYPSRDYLVEREGKLLNIPLVVLINQGSASASEILSGALRDHKRAKLVGEKTFGKGSVQEALDLQEGAGLHVTVAKWILPNGDWINSKGIEPDIKIENTVKEGNTLTKEEDKQLPKALELLK
ncbi:hypothetical protein COW98_05055 [Candidatus Roizmanbacteria bacterium CG22_combo_CG10-13_8_21_14_all_35_9]|uniref:S41 family peptidase n=4 Tax=Candidatus Roizmaniibacteriota TaxID=1752723 RepID=A0A2M8F202_9BACT|nr:MAG: hypothetical protein COX47_03120 [Candidatus Roizmanbacteria bacterium CG23_combo_of_CG06-09_8_20_14_all_35_49]PIP62252.1 MAG: hypothetical protein COW98_05055 [Candidatus Roizmanbacteria bacterium CG22_combo_CG10-13_8_21_14_all_35_9]PIY71032.1 MAG: S41 family peptidase [Candidatus Roizmanbacteria bacterium CG_4_10_14_0_8_um_filter_35_28]PJC33319.1 MAG: S41 family peptidase [Candidatus Roizmanbacteria bacterium CG_4_9_14_0_2_um_filter_35_15]PJC82941.1 MAG: S41 family peptidase [Candidat